MQREQRGQRQAATSRIPGQCGVWRGVTLGAQPRQHGQRVLQRRGVPVLGRQPVVHTEHARAGLGRQARHEFAVRGERADLEATPMEVDDHAVGARTRRGDPGAGHATGGDGLEGGVAGRAEQRVPVGAHLGHGGVAAPAAVDRFDAGDDGIDRIGHAPHPMPPETPSTSPVT